MNHKLLSFLFLLICLSAHAEKYTLTYADQLMLRGEEAFKNQDMIGAIPFLDSCILLNPTNDQCRFTRAKIAYAMKQYEEAKYLFQSVLAITPKDGVAWNLLGLTYTELKRYDSAIACYQQSVSIDATNSKFFSNWARNEYERGDYAHAERLYETAIFLEPSFATHYRNRAEARLKQGKKDMAIEDLNQAVKIDPKDNLAKQSLDKANGSETKMNGLFLVAGAVCVFAGLWWYRRSRATKTIS